MDLDEIKAESARLSMWAHIATVGRDGRVFDYHLSVFVPGGPDNSPGAGFISVEPERVLLLKAYGMGGRETWRKS